MSDVTETVYAGLDLGTSGCKGVLVTGDGRVVARAAARYPTHRPEPGAAEQHPADWLKAFTSVTLGLAQAVAAERWQAIGLSAMLPTLVLTDGAGAVATPGGIGAPSSGGYLEPVGPAITWEDGRAEAEGSAFRDGFGGDALYRRTGQWVDGRYLVPMALRLAAREPERVAAARYLLGAKDYLFGVLTGEVLTDPSTATGTGCYDLAVGDWIAEVVPPGLPRLPEIAPSTTARPLRPAAAGLLGLVAGTPVVLGGADSVLGALGLGLTTPGQAAYIAGTSTVILALADTLALDAAHRYLITPMARPGSWGLEMDLLATGSAHAWLAGLLTGGDQTALARLADEADPETAPLFLPYLLPGEQGARWDPDLAGALSGLHLGHGAGDLARGLRNGIVAESRHCLAVLESAAGRGEILMAGGGALAPSLARDLADATGRATRPPDPSLTDSSAIGAAIIAAAGATGQVVAVRPDRKPARLAPDPGRTAWWGWQAQRHESAVARQQLTNIGAGELFVSWQFIGPVKMKRTVLTVNQEGSLVPPNRSNLGAHVGKHPGQRWAGHAGLPGIAGYRGR
jgi:xylulokinase